MTLAAFALVMASAFLHAGWNTAAKKARHPVAFLLCSQAVISAMCLPLLAATFVRQPGSAQGVGIALASGIVQAAYLILLGLAYALADLSLVYPLVRAVAACVVASAAVPLFGETISSRGLLGIALITLGVFALHVPRDAAGSGGKPPARRWRLGALLAVLTASIAGYQLIDKVGVTLLGPAPYLCFATFSDTASFAAWTAARRGGTQARAEWKSGWTVIVAAAAMALGSYLLYLWALRLAQVSYLAPLRNVSMVVAVFLGAAVLRERLALARIPGALILCAGAFLLASP